MLQFKIPQNVQVEDKIVPFLTVRQLIICCVGGGIAYTFYITLSKSFYIEVWGPPTGISLLITAAIAFLKINDIPFTKWFLLLMEFLLVPRKRVWDKSANRDLLFGFVSTVAVNSASKKPKIENVKPEKNLTSLQQIALDLEKSPLKNLSNFRDKSAENSEQRLQKNIAARAAQNFPAENGWRF